MRLLLAAIPLLLPAQDCAVRLKEASDLYGKKQYNLSTRAFELALAACPQRVPVLLNLAKSQIMEQAFEAASATLEKILHLDAKNAEALKLHGDVFYLLGQEIEAEKSLLAAIEQDPRNPEPHYALGRIYYQQNRFEQSIAQFKKVIELDPKSYRAWDNMGLAYEGLNEIPRAIEHYEKAFALVHKDHPDYDWVYGNMSNLLYKTGDYKKAFQFAAEAASRNPNSGRNFFLAGKALAKLDKPELAAKWLSQAVELDASLSEAHYQYAQVLRSLGKHEDARRRLQIFQEVKAKEPRKRR